MLALAAATALVVLSHLVPMWPGARDRLVAGLGRRPYLMAHSVLSLVALGLLGWAWTAAEPALSPLEPGLLPKRAAVLLMPLAFALVAGRLMARRRAPMPAGLFTLTATPGSLGMLLWALLHVAAASDARALVVFSGFALIALFSLARNARALPPELAEVGWVPLRAVLAGRVRPDLGGLLPPLAAGTVAWVALLYAHPLLIGPDPLAYVTP
ncbi:MAG TPA: NnrU family protein [Azospirillaceae bacterium]|nr:NnrU family protein [Azospirillaceae bacterium]